MKIALLTIWHCENYGAEMQLYATVKALTELGHEVNVIDFRLSDYKSTIKSQIVRLLTFFTPNYQHFRSFWKEHIKTTDHYYKLEELKANPPKADAYIVGSDQVWNEDITRNRASAYFLDFGSEEIRRISYASSIGVDKWTFSKDFTELAKRQIKKFSFISCRENTGANILSDALNVKVENVLDPTLLYDNYTEITGKLFDKKTIVYYPLSKEDVSLVTFCKDLSVEMKLKYVNANPYTLMLGLPIVWNRNSVKRWVKTIGEAAFVVTGSFHGLAFSLINHRQFVIINPNKNGRNSRITDLLRLLGLMDRFFTNVEDAKASKIWTQKIDYDKVDLELLKARQYSWDYLRRCLS